NSVCRRYFPVIRLIADPRVLVTTDCEKDILVDLKDSCTNVSSECQTSQDFQDHAEDTGNISTVDDGGKDEDAFDRFDTGPFPSLRDRVKKVGNGQFLLDEKCHFEISKTVFKCISCDLLFASKYPLKRHIHDCPGNPSYDVTYSYKHCGRVYDEVRNGTLRCRQCKYMCWSRKKMILHLRKFHAKRQTIKDKMKLLSSIPYTKRSYMGKSPEEPHILKLNYMKQHIRFAHAKVKDLIVRRYSTSVRVTVYTPQPLDPLSTVANVPERFVVGATEERNEGINEVTLKVPNSTYWGKLSDRVRTVSKGKYLFDGKYAFEYSEKKWVCCSCNHKFQKKIPLMNHLAETCKGGVFKAITTHKFAWINAFNQAYSFERVRDTYECNQCSFSTSTSLLDFNIMKSHVLSLHFDKQKQSWSCNMCGRKCCSSSMLKKHLERHTRDAGSHNQSEGWRGQFFDRVRIVANGKFLFDEKFAFEYNSEGKWVCCTCKYPFQRKIGIVKHLASSCNGYCSFSNSSLSYMKVHIRCTHIDPGSSTCSKSVQVEQMIHEIRSLDILGCWIRRH
ncbi:unnamed protein product, partial [Allacma fusca]